MGKAETREKPFGGRFWDSPTSPALGSHWLFQGDEAKDRPADLGYYIGYKICESYYRNASNKTQAVRDIIEVNDFEQFLKASGYEEKFKGK